MKETKTERQKRLKIYEYCQFESCNVERDGSYMPCSRCQTIDSKERIIKLN